MSEKCCCGLCSALRVPSVVKKYIVAVTGLVLVLFLIIHVIGNLQMFGAPEKINTYAHMLHALPPAALWGFRAFILLCFVVHFGLAIYLKLQNLAARGPEKYAANATRYAAWSARAMVITGALVLAFVIFHICQFTIFKEASLFGMAAYENATTIQAAGAHGFFGYLGLHTGLENFAGTPLEYKVFDVYQMVYNAFANPLISLAYVVGMICLFSHLSHGAHSMFQSVGLRNEKMRPIFRVIALIYAIAVCAGLAAVPAGVLSGAIQPNPDTTAPKAETWVICPLAIDQTDVGRPANELIEAEAAPAQPPAPAGVPAGENPPPPPPEGAQPPAGAPAQPAPQTAPAQQQ